MLECDPRVLPEALSKESLDWNLQKIMNTLTYKHVDSAGFQIRPTVIGFDTETYASNGDIMTLCLSDGNHIEFKNNEMDFEKIVTFFKPYIQKNVIFFAWNLGFDAMILLKNLGLKIQDLKDNDFKLKEKNFNIF